MSRKGPELVVRREGHRNGAEIFLAATATAKLVDAFLRGLVAMRQKKPIERLKARQ
jgi:hypothetical protein